MIRVYIKKPVVYNWHKGIFYKSKYVYKVSMKNAMSRKINHGIISLSGVKSSNQARIHLLVDVLRRIQKMQHIKAGYSVSEPVMIYMNDLYSYKKFWKYFIYKRCSVLTLIRLKYHSYNQSIIRLSNLLKMFPATRLEPCTEKYIAKRD